MGTAVIAAPPNRLILFAHGAGAGSNSGFMRTWRARLAEYGRVETFDYPYMQHGRKSPDPLPKLIAAHRDALYAAGPANQVVLAGKSMGSRVGCHVALTEAITGLVCFGYPLKGQSGAVRDEVLLALTTPILFVQGSRDSLCPLSLLDDVRKRMQARNELCVIDGGDHSLQVTRSALKAQSKAQEDVELEILQAVGRFLNSL